jgi:5-hydroxyisourate hydrolase
MGISTHILDTSRGKPAADVSVRLEVWRDGRWSEAGAGRTNRDGRVVLTEAAAVGVWRITFDTSDYLPDGFYPEIVVTFKVRDAVQHYHVPLLLSPFGYSTYRGS